MKTIIWLILFFPYGLYRMWKHEEWPQTVKAGVSVLIVAALVVGLRQQQKAEVVEEVPREPISEAAVKIAVSRTMNGAWAENVIWDDNTIKVEYKTDNYFNSEFELEKTYIYAVGKIFSQFDEIDYVILTSVQKGKTYRFQITYPEFEQYTTFSRKSLRQHWNQYDRDYVYDKDKRLLFFERFLKLK